MSSNTKFIIVGGGNNNDVDADDEQLLTTGGKNVDVFANECAKNILCGNVQLSPKQKTALRHNKQNLRRLSIKKTSLKKKPQIIQKGGFLGAILAPVIATLGGSLISSLFGKC